jgi:hypothetical protein
MLYGCSYDASGGKSEFVAFFIIVVILLLAGTSFGMKMKIKMNVRVFLLTMMLSVTSVNAMQEFQLDQSESGRTDSSNCSFSRQDEMVLLCSDGT